MKNFKIIVCLLAVSTFLVQCGTDDPNSIEIERITKELKSIKNKNIVFGVNKPGTEKNVNLQNLLQKMEELDQLNDATKNSYLASKEYIISKNSSSNAESNKNRLALNDFLFKKFEALQATLLDAKVYEGSEIKNANWLVLNQIEQLQFLKKEMDGLRKTD